MNVATTHTLFRQHGTPRRSTEEGRIDIEDVSVVFGSGPAAHTAVERTSLAIPPGEFV